MNSNLVQQSFTYKDLLLRKLSFAVTSSVFSQLLILLLYVLLSKIDVFHPVSWLLAAIQTVTSISTWIFIIPFVCIIFAQTVICAKDYVLKSSYCSTRFQKFVATFSIHNLTLALLHVLVGALLIWLFLSLCGQSLIEICKRQAYCLNEGSFFLILSGLWTGLYFFVKIYIAEKNLSFPVINQRKFLQLKSELGRIIKKSITSSFWPSLYFSIFYYLYGAMLQNGFKNLFGLLKHNNEMNISTYLYLWFFSALYYFNMNLMRFYFNLFLTEPVKFPLIKDQTGNLTLQDGIMNHDWPIVQNLACIDLYILSQWHPSRRQVFFHLSNPGGHPHNWNSLVENVLKLITEYTQVLNNSIDLPERSVKPQQIMQAPIIQGPNKFRNLRNMAMIDKDDCCNFIDVSKSQVIDFSVPVDIFTKLATKLDNMWNFLKLILGINFFFDELPQANVRKCLANGNLIIWASQGISGIVTASLEEDRFGVVQKDLGAIITSLVNLKQSLDKLNKIPALTRKMVGYDDFNYQMKGAVSAAVKRSLFSICQGFDDYLKDIPLESDICHYLQSHIICKS